MGTSADINDEWMELYNNTGFSLDLTGWKLQAEDGVPDIELSGKIEPYGYYLLERTDDTTISDIDADQIYTGALDNGGEKLELRDSENNLIDYIDCSVEWHKWHKGNNVNKTAMERIDPIKDGGENNWADNNGAEINGIAKDKISLIKGTPRAKNSATIAGGINPHSGKVLFGNISQDTTFTRAESPYILWGITVDENVVLESNQGLL